MRVDVCGRFATGPAIFVHTLSSVDVVQVDVVDQVDQVDVVDVVDMD